MASNLFGPNHAAVLEVVDLALSNVFDHPAPRALPPDARRVPVALAPEDTVVQYRPGLLLDWLDLLEHERAAYVTPLDPAFASDAERDLLEARLEDPITRINAHLSAKLARWRRPHGLDSLACALLTDCAMARLCSRTPLAFWERCLACLKTGGIPVGHTGAWPSGGTLLVFYPGVAG